MVTNDNDSVKVLIRVRPIHEDQDAISISNDKKTISIESPQRHLSCKYDEILPPDTSQEEVFQNVSYIAKSVLEGFNATIMTYGQTGSGKSYTMFGCEDGSNPGIVTRIINSLFESLSGVDKSFVHVSFLQIHNENVYDLFDSRMKKLTVHEKHGKISVPNLGEFTVSDSSQCKALVELGLRHRTIASTTMNHVSSRSHAILQVTIEQRNHSTRKISKLNLVDLAGSERFGVSGLNGDRVGELTNINASLSTLGRCIAALATKSESSVLKSPQRPIHIPYRDSKLTRILQDSLGGNSKTVLIAMVNPSIACADESISTLRFADRAQNVIQTAYVNESRIMDSKTTAELHNEIKRLRDLLDQHGIPHENTNTECSKLSIQTFDEGSEYIIHSTTCQRIISLIGSAITLMEDYLVIGPSNKSNFVNFSDVKENQVTDQEGTTEQKRMEKCEDRKANIITSKEGEYKSLSSLGSLLQKRNTLKEKDIRNTSK
jgi:kinesin family protein 3/17